MKDITPDTAGPPVHPLTAAREALDPPLSREGLAFKSGVSFKTIERIERGDVRPHRATLKAIADVLEVDPSTLLLEQAA